MRSAVVACLDGVSQGTVDANTPQRQARQGLYTASGPAPGPHPLTVTELSGTHLLVDGFTLD